MQVRSYLQMSIALAMVTIAARPNGLLAWSMLGKARAVHSVALEVDARRLFINVWPTVGVVLGLLAVMAAGWGWLDPVVAIAVALNILRVGASLVWQAAGGLMDEALEPAQRATVERVLVEHSHDNVRFDHVTSRRAAEERGRVERALMQALPGLRASIQLLPLGVEADLGDEIGSA